MNCQCMQNRRANQVDSGPCRDEFDLDETTSSFVAKTAAFVMELMTEAPHRCHD